MLTENSPTRILVTTNPTKMEYKPGENISYSGLVVCVVYEDNTMSEITSSCSITPSSGKAFDVRTDTDVSISYRGLSASLLLAKKSSILRVTNPPSKTVYNPGESMDYTGIVVQAEYLDGTRHNLTNYCNFEPVAGTVYTLDITRAIISGANLVDMYVYDQNLGYIDNSVCIIENVSTLGLPIPGFLKDRVQNLKKQINLDTKALGKKTD